VGNHVYDFSLRLSPLISTLARSLSLAVPTLSVNTKTPFAQARSAQAQTASLDQISVAGRDGATAPAKILITVPSQAIIRRGQ